MIAPKRVPRGSAERWTDKTLDAMSEVTPEDIEDAKLAWRADASSTGST